MLNRRELSTVVWTEVWCFDGNASQLVCSALSSADTRPRCNQLTGDVPSNVGLRDDGLVSFELYVPAGGTVLAHGRAGVGIQGTISDPIANSNLSANININGRVGFGRLSGGTGMTLGRRAL